MKLKRWFRVLWGPVLWQWRSVRGELHLSQRKLVWHLAVRTIYWKPKKSKSVVLHLQSTVFKALEHFASVLWCHFKRKACQWGWMEWMMYGGKKDWWITIKELTFSEFEGKHRWIGIPDSRGHQPSLQWHWLHISSQTPVLNRVKYVNEPNIQCILAVKTTKWSTMEWNNMQVPRDVF